MTNRNVLTYLLIFFVCSICFSQANDFRSINWGMTREQINKIEDKTILTETDDYVAYEVTIAGFNAWLVYNFIDNQCVNSRYMLKVNHSNNNSYIDDYIKLKGILTKLYGTPIEDEIIWKNDLYKDDPDEYGMALCIGHLFYYASWQNTSTEITIELGGDNYEINHFIIFYDSIKYKALMEEKNTEEETSGL